VRPGCEHGWSEDCYRRRSRRWVVSARYARVKDRRKTYSSSMLVWVDSAIVERGVKSPVLAESETDEEPRADQCQYEVTQSDEKRKAATCAC
jgi:hypothetical protein